jgi:hypothetical protein
VAVEFLDRAGGVEFDRRGVGWVGDVVGGTRQSKGGASTATSTVAVEFMDRAGVVRFDRRGRWVG